MIFPRLRLLWILSACSAAQQRQIEALQREVGDLQGRLAVQERRPLRAGDVDRVITESAWRRTSV
jgi:hypothetical protein